MKNHIEYHTAMPHIDDLRRQAAADRLAAEVRASDPARRRHGWLSWRRRSRRMAPAGRSLRA
jgi:hypothetical protein